MNRTSLLVARWWHLAVCLVLLAAAGPAYALPSEAHLSGLALSPAAPLNPSPFAATTFSYTASVPGNVDLISVTPTATDPLATVTVNGTAVPNGTSYGPVFLTPLPATNVFTTVVTAQDGITTLTYTVTITRVASNNASLSNLALSQGVLSPAFAAGTLSYTASVPTSVASITLTPTVAFPVATVKVNGATVASGAPSGAIALAPGLNTITTVVTAEDGVTTQTYTVSVNRAGTASTDANLSSLVLSNGTLTPTFSAATTNYTAVVCSGTQSITVTPTVESSTATVTVNGLSPSTPVNLGLGPNVIPIVVTAQDGVTTKTYTLTVTRNALSSDAALGNLTLSVGTLSPTFAGGTTSYAASVGYSVNFINAFPTTHSMCATVTVNNIPAANGGPSSPIGLGFGSNVITTKVTAEDGATNQTYTVTVTRASVPAANASLAGLALSTGTLAPAFAGGTTAYTVAVGNNVASIAVTPTVADSTATVKVNGTAVASGTASGPIALNVGGNTIAIVVTAGDGATTVSYRVVVTRAAGTSTNANLGGLALSSGTLSPAFAAGTTAYAATASGNVNSVTVTPTLADATASARVDGASVASGSASAAIPLNAGNNTITILVTAGDGVTTKSYTVVVTLPVGTSAWPYLNTVVPNVAGLPNILDMGSSGAQAFLPGMLNALSAPLGAGLRFIGQSPSGAAMVGTVNNTNVAFMPLFFGGSTSLADGLYPRGADQFNVVGGGTLVSVAPAIYNLGQFVGLLGGAQVNIDANGTMSAMIGGTTFVVQPSYQVQILSPTGTPALSAGGDGYLHFADASGFSQTLYPAFLELDTLGQALYSLAFVSSSMTQTGLNGTIVVQALGNQYLALTPDISLGTVPAQHAGDAWWQEGLNRYRIQNVLHPGTSQGFTLTFLSVPGG